MGKNYIVKPNKWQPLSDVMALDYGHNKVYALHVNQVNRGCLRVEYTSRVPDNNSDRGREIPQFSVIHLDKDVGDDVYLMASNTDININVFEITST